MVDISSQKQSYFKPVTAETEKQTIIQSLVRGGLTMQVKDEAAKVGQGQLTMLKAEGMALKSIAAVKVDGPDLERTHKVTIVFELSKQMFFCSGKTIRGKKVGEYFVDIEKIFELQRRDSFRVVISPQIIKARFHVSLLNGGALAKEFRIVDLSAGGLGLAIPEENVSLFKAGTILHGVILVGAHPSIEIKCEVKYQRKVTEGKTVSFHVGCQTQELTLALSQRIAFLVNDCHRITFSKIAK